MVKRLTSEQQECLEKHFQLCDELEPVLVKLKRHRVKCEEVFKDFDPDNLPKWADKKVGAYQARITSLVKHLFLD